MEKITLYTNPYSRGRIIRWLLEECGADYEVVPVPFGENGTKSADYLAVNPMGKLPAEKNLIPAGGTAERGEFYRWLMFAQHAEYAFIDKSHGIPETPERKRSIGYGSFDEVVATLTAFLRGKEYALGNHFTALDVYLSGLIALGIMWVQVLDMDSELGAFMKRHAARPAFAKSQALDAELAKQMGLE